MQFTLGEIEGAIHWWRVRASSDAGFAGSAVGCALARLYGETIAEHRVVPDNELYDLQRDALRIFVRVSTVLQETEVQR
ncbi:DUF3717 domain-containing protein [Paraburkholderia sp. MM5384-R2]|uniref:DUF3717 domain-containing protein n=1 Tax=Paraburkholderia sp. MM5384-R2 TaxID=2723097 RepID=UPI001617BD0A|nr:DUF3717 domain-containing protein [Paraburkholderia sp. MM5384-R2]MBB5498751.1 hypothetical protein [Paraburkholderia sp. MM5384-R2]